MFVWGEIMPAYEKDVDKILARLKRIEGQMRGIQRMVEENKYCVDILTQVSSVIAATEKVGLIILRDHIKGCVYSSLQEGNSEERIDELVMVVERFLKT
ncbi:MAG TPA: transcriptional regulator [Actinobacteria bacterium]|nr:transcriptional regulator [Actinomycetota bacterium]